ncbi:MAG: hypothetical protein Q9165_006336 [Trypethelium subeluteriae]
MSLDCCLPTAGEDSVHPEQSDRENDESFEWPTSSLPNAENLTRASELCAAVIGIDASCGTATCYQSGWSAHDCIRIDFPLRSFIVKIPRKPSTSAASICRAEATRTAWAAAHAVGPRVYATDDQSGAFAMECLKGNTLSADMASQSLHQILDLLHKIHKAPARPWMRVYSPITVVEEYLDAAKSMDSMPHEDIQLVETVLEDTRREIGQIHSYPDLLVPCHNDFHSHNIILGSDGNDQYMAIDFENTDLGDPMWDLAYLTVNLDLEREPLALADAYHTTTEERRRLNAYCLLAITHCATWSAIHGAPWVKHRRDLMARLRQIRVEFI